VRGAVPVVVEEADVLHAQLLAVTLDDQPLATSRRILLQVMSEERASGFAIEAVAENLEIKRTLWRFVEELRAPGSIVSRCANAASCISA